MDWEYGHEYKEKTCKFCGEDSEKDWEVFQATKRLWEAENNDIKPKCYSYALGHKA